MLIAYGELVPFFVFLYFLSLQWESRIVTIIQTLCFLKADKEKNMFNLNHFKFNV